MSVPFEKFQRVGSGDTGLSLAPAFWFLCAIAAGIAFFWYGIVSLGNAWQTPEYSHGPLIPIISGFLFLQEMRHLPPRRGAITDQWWPGVLVVSAALLVGLLGNLTQIPDIVTYGMILYLWGLVLVVNGWTRGRLLWPSILHLVFMLPLPQFIYWKVSIYLQTVSSEIGVQLIMLFDIPVFLDGNIIDLGVYKLHVAEACSGLRYLFPIMSFSYVFALLYRGPMWHKAVLLLSCVPITVLLNSFRIGVIGVLVNSYGIGHAEGFLHLFEGWVIFLSCVLLLIGLVVCLRLLTRGSKGSIADAIELDFNGAGTQLAKIQTIVPSRALVVSAILPVICATAWYASPGAKSVVVEREQLVAFSRSFDGWRGNLSFVEPEIEAVLGADDYLSAHFQNKQENGPVGLFVAYYNSQTEGSGIHSPEVCLPVGGWEVSTWSQKPISFTDSTGNQVSFEVNRAVIQKGLAQQVVYYWLEGRGRRLTSDYVAKAYTVLDQITMSRSDGALVRVITPISKGETEADADARLQRFLPGMVSRLPEFVPQ